MKKEIIYVRICIALVSIAILWGYVSPQLISAPSDILVVLGVLIFLATPILIWRIIKPIFKSNINKIKEEKNEKSII